MFWWAWFGLSAEFSSKCNDLHSTRYIQPLSLNVPCPESTKLVQSTVGIILQGLRYVLLGLSCISIITSSLRLFQCPCFRHFPPIFFLLSHFSKRFLRRHALAQLSNKPSRRVSRADAENSGSRLPSLHLPLAQHQRPSQFQAMSSRTAGLLKSRVASSMLETVQVPKAANGPQTGHSL